MILSNVMSARQIFIVVSSFDLFFTRLWPVSQCNRWLSVDNGDIKCSLHRRFIKTRKNFSGAGGLHLGAGDESEDMS